MLRFIPRDPRTAAWLAVAIAFALAGVLVSWAVGRHLSERAETEWIERAHEDAARLTRRFNSSLDHIEENVRMVQALFAASDVVTQAEFVRFGTAAHSSTYDIDLDAAAFADCSESAPDAPVPVCSVEVTDDSNGLVTIGTVPQLGASYEQAIVAARNAPDSIVFSRPVRVGLVDYILIAATARNAGRSGIILGFLNVQRLFNHFETESPVGLDLQRLTDSAAVSAATKIVAFDQDAFTGTSTEHHFFDIEGPSQGNRWAATWMLSPTYQGGPAVGLGGWIGIAGSALSILAALLMAILIRQNSLINQRVRERTMDLARARLEADRANKAKSMFLANMSHELRTPLNAIIGFSEVIKDDLLGPKEARRYKEYARDINASGSHLLELVNDVIDISKIDAGHLTLNLEATEVCTLMESSLRQVRRQANGKEISIHTEVPGGLPQIEVDPLRIRQALINVLGNAVKFTPNGGQIWLAAALQDNGEVALQVTDSGPGIAEKDMEKVMQPFGQVDEGMARRYEGAGLGLPLAKRFLELHGGDLKVTSAQGQGTTVTLLLPTARHREQTATAELQPQGATTH